ncbi:MAG: hypothetical protein K6T85_14530 [Gorillibacterium sp.]|nr:hypothetical protein [Gorillibacterium sp.]
MTTYNINVFNCLTGNFDLGTVTLSIPEPQQVRFVRQPSGNLFVSLLGTNQTLIALPAPFSRITGADRRSVLGSLTLNDAQVRELGFILPPEGVSDNVRHAELLPA